MNCTISENSANDGGGLYNNKNGSLINCTVVGNSATEFGGGIEFDEMGTVENCNINWNVAGWGGGIACGENVIVKNCKIKNNTADNYGAGICSWGATIMNCVVSDNNGIGGYISYGSYINCTIVNNSDYGIYYENYGGSGCQIKNSIVYNNNENYGGSIIDFSYSCTYPLFASGEGNISNNPGFVDFDVGNYQLADNSPCINAGTNAYVETTTDLNGNSRIFNNIVDMGCYEKTFRYVSLDGMHVSPFMSWKTAATNIQAAVDVAIDSDTVLITNGIYNIFSEILVDKNITIKSVNGPYATTILSDGSSRCFNLENCFSILNGLKISNGNANSGNGGGVLCLVGVPVLTNCIISNNRAEHGGGLFFDDDRGATILDCVIIENTAVIYGGIYTDYNSIIINCNIISNSANVCGGVNLDHSGIIKNCNIEWNSADYYGGISGSGSSTIVKNCKIRHNTAANDAAGIYAVSGVSVLNCLISDNYGNGAFGFINSFVNCTIVNNSGYGLYYYDGFCDIENSIIYNNAGGNYNGNHTLLNFSYSCTQPMPSSGIGNISDNPEFVEANCYRLRSSSPCINSGNNSYVQTSYDLEGNQRIIDGIVDMGALENVLPITDINAELNGDNVILTWNGPVEVNVFTNLTQFYTPYSPTNYDWGIAGTNKTSPFTFVMPNANIVFIHLEHPYNVYPLYKAKYDVVVFRTQTSLNSVKEMLQNNALNNGYYIAKIIDSTNNIIVALIYGEKSFIAEFEADITEAELKELINFYPHINSDKVNYHWTFGDGGESTESNPIYQYFDEGEYTIKLEISTPNGYDIVTKEKYISIIPEPGLLFVVLWIIYSIRKKFITFKLRSKL